MNHRALSEPEWSRLAEAARQASHRAYCPYSRFAVGAALLAGNGEIYSGCNVENASFGLSICAERNAVFQMVAQGQQVIHAIVVYTPTLQPTTPCGACRQVIHEFGPEAALLCLCDSADTIHSRLDALLPSAFGPSRLNT